jgi:urease accessory protein
MLRICGNSLGGEKALRSLLGRCGKVHNVGASLDVMERDARLQRGRRPFIFTDLKDGTGLPETISWLEQHLKT